MPLASLFAYLALLCPRQACNLPQIYMLVLLNYAGVQQTVTAQQVKLWPLTKPAPRAPVQPPPTMQLVG